MVDATFVKRFFTFYDFHYRRLLSSRIVILLKYLQSRLTVTVLFISQTW